MDNVKDLTPLSDSDLEKVAGGSVGTGNSTDFCDACSGGAKKIFFHDQKGALMSCRNCGKVYETCPKCGAGWNPAEALQNGAKFWCINYHSFFCTYN